MADREKIGRETRLQSESLIYLSPKRQAEENVIKFLSTAYSERGETEK